MGKNLIITLMEAISGCSDYPTNLSPNVQPRLHPKYSCWMCNKSYHAVEFLWHIRKCKDEDKV